LSKSVIITGVGIAGLATGCYAQMNGYVGQWAEATGGLPPVAISGRKLIQAFCRRDRRSLVTAVPSSQA